MFVGKSAKVEYLQILLERQSTEGISMKERDKALQQAITAYIEENGKQENKWISDGNSLIYHSIGKYQAHAPILHKMPLLLLVHLPSHGNKRKEMSQYTTSKGRFDK